MENKIKEAFDQVTMREGCIDRIEKSMFTQHERRSLRWSSTWRAASAVAAVIVLLVVLVAGNADVVHALENVIEEVISAVTPVEELHVEESHTFLDGLLKDETYVDSEGNRSISGSFTLAKPRFLVERDGRLFFTANGENLDITDMISMEVPFLYSYTDEEMFTHYYAVGISVPDAETILEQAGWSYWVQDAEAAKEAYHGSWITGCSKGHYNNKLDMVLPWHEKAIEAFHIPWSV